MGVPSSEEINVLPMGPCLASKRADSYKKSGPSLVAGFLS
jgi:hypothetical protein